ncbi:MAG: hypothetical protein ACREX4_24445, partial [Gammaproteobacteria bacterium]
WGCGRSSYYVAKKWWRRTITPAPPRELEGPQGTWEDGTEVTALNIGHEVVVGRRRSSGQSAVAARQLDGAGGVEAEWRLRTPAPRAGSRLITRRVR